MDKITHLIGPISLTEHYSKEYKKHIYIFGDRHTLTSVCKESKTKMKIEKFLDLTFKSTKKNIDFFLEYEFIHKESIQRIEKISNYMEDVGKYFDKCFQLDKSECKIPNVRFHYSDIRAYSGNVLGRFYNRAINLYAIGVQSSDLLENKGIIGVLINMIEKECKEILDLSDNEWLPFIMKEMWNMKVGKQFSGVSDEIIKEALINMFKLCIKKDEDEYPTIRIILNNIKDKLGNIWNLTDSEKYFIMKSIKAPFSKIINDMVCVMDIYVLSRMFRKFTPKFQQQYSGEPENIIIYAGDAHANNYRKFLRCIGFEKINDTRDNDQCIDISKFKQPFFS